VRNSVGIGVAHGAVIEGLQHGSSARRYLTRSKPCVRKPLFGAVERAGEHHKGHSERCGDRGNLAGLDEADCLQT
jgi:hypothetical protein